MNQAPFFANIFFILLMNCCLVQFSNGQTAAKKTNNYPLVIEVIGKDSSFNLQSLQLKSVFTTRELAIEYALKIPALIFSLGYPAASVDSIWENEESVHARLFLGSQYYWMHLTPVGIEKKALDEIGFIDKYYINKPVDINRVRILQTRLLHYYEKSGFPFAKVFLDSVKVENEKMIAQLRSDKSVAYYIDSIRIDGDVRVQNKFLQNYLMIPNHSLYNKDKLDLVDQRLKELPYLTVIQPSDLIMVGSGSVLNLHLNQKKNSQVNVLLGLLPASGTDQKVQLTGDVLLDLKNTFGRGESLLVKWQQLQRKSPRLNLGFSQPYIFNSPLGFDFLFDLFKKDSSFLQVNVLAGLDYFASPGQTGKIFMQWKSNTLLEGGLDSNMVKEQKKLPPNIDVKSVNIGVQYKWEKTNYLFNPRSGNEILINATAGIKNILRNAQITGLVDPTFKYSTLYDSLRLKSYQICIKISAAHYFPLAKMSVLKMALQAGLYESPDIFRNELFQIGGFRLLRGFDEESIYATRYTVATFEYRYLLGQNSYLFAFADAAMVQNHYQQVDLSNQFLGLGMGINYQTKSGLITISYAAGLRSDVSFNIREASKIHFGYIHYF